MAKSGLPSTDIARQGSSRTTPRPATPPTPTFARVHPSCHPTDARPVCRGTAARGTARSLCALPSPRRAADLLGLRRCLRRRSRRSATTLRPMCRRAARGTRLPPRSRRACSCDNLPHPAKRRLRTMPPVPSGLRRDDHPRGLRGATRHADDSSEIPWRIAVRSRVRTSPRRRACRAGWRRAPASGAGAAGAVAARRARLQPGVGAGTRSRTARAPAGECPCAASRTNDRRTAPTFTRSAAMQPAQRLHGERTSSRTPRRAGRRCDDDRRHLRCGRGRAQTGGRHACARCGRLAYAAFPITLPRPTCSTSFSSAPKFRPTPGM